MQNLRQSQPNGTYRPVSRRARDRQARQARNETIGLMVMGLVALVILAVIVAAVVHFFGHTATPSSSWADDSMAWAEMVALVATLK
jgi:hypothetical protein